jgi:glyceraldehyde 3-phosphate dehydrogenase
MVVKCGINGGGRIGRHVIRAWLKQGGPKTGISFVAVNDPFTNISNFAYLFQYDSVHGKSPWKVEFDEKANTITIDGNEIKVSFHRNPAEIPWGEMGVHTVLESSGVFLTRELAGNHLKGGAKRVVLSAPAKGEGIPHFVLGVNQKDFDPKMDIISNASCTTNCLAPVCKVLHENFGIESGLLNTIHAYTATQAPVDRLSPKNPRLGRSAATNCIPSSTGAAKTVGKVLPALKGKLDGMSVRVPVPDVSLCDFTVLLEKETTLEEIMQAFRTAAEGDLKGILDVTNEPVVSSDFTSDPRSSIVDEDASMAISTNKKFFKIVSWYDNEVIYATRCVDLLRYIKSVEEK